MTRWPTSTVAEQATTIAELQGELAARDDTIAELTARIDRHLAPHTPYLDGNCEQRCNCGAAYPCPTVRALSP